MGGEEVKEQDYKYCKVLEPVKECRDIKATVRTIDNIKTSFSYHYTKLAEIHHSYEWYGCENNFIFKISFYAFFSISFFLRILERQIALKKILLSRFSLRFFLFFFAFHNQTQAHHTEPANLFLLPSIYIQARLHFFSFFFFPITWKNKNEGISLFFHFFLLLFFWKRKAECIFFWHNLYGRVSIYWKVSLPP